MPRKPETPAIEPEGAKEAPPAVEPETQKTPTPDAPPAAPDLRVTARQYTIARGKRWERSAGFLHWAAERFGVGSRVSIREWEARWSEFWSTPVTR